MQGPRVAVIGLDCGTPQLLFDELQAVGLAMLMVLIAHRIEDVWWWSWAFALVTTAMAAVTLLNVAFGLGPHQPAGLWWLLSAIFVLFALSLLFGLYAASQEQPNPG